MECFSCRSISGEQRISPGPTIFEGRFWLLEHAYPTCLKGWLVLVLKRHAEALHDLTAAEFRELAELQARTTQLLFREFGCEKEYSICLAEAEHFHHIHFHLVPKPKDLPMKLKGAKIFALLNVDKAGAISKDEIKALCEDLRQKFTWN